MSQNYEYFGKYILLEKLAMGGMAEVWLARAPGASGIGKFVAIKKILPQYSDNPEFIQMFKDEASIAMNLSHSNIVSIYEFGQEKSQLFLVMDYVEGRNLRQILNKMKDTTTKFSTDQVVYMVKEVAAGLDHAHRSLNSATGKPLNITHRDMSPQNVMITFEGEVKIVDFGIAKAESQMENTRTGTLKGKFGYMSPEQAEGLPTDLRTDIFSLGICLWELLAGERLFIAKNEIETLKKIRDCNVPDLSKINPNIQSELNRIVMKALSRDRNLRYQTAAAFQRDLNRYLNRQFPDFSAHDFSVFIKTLYTEEILDIRKRLIEYSKIPFRHTISSSKTVTIDEADKTMVTSFPQIPDAKSRRKEEGKNTDPEDENSLLAAEATITETETFTATNNSDAFSKLEKSINTNPDIQSEKKPVLDSQYLRNSSRVFQDNKTPALPESMLDNTPISSSNIAQAKGYKSRRASDHENFKTPVKRVRPASGSSANFFIFIAFTVATYLVGSSYYPQQFEQVVATTKVLLQLESKIENGNELGSQMNTPNINSPSANGAATTPTDTATSTETNTGRSSAEPNTMQNTKGAANANVNVVNSQSSQTKITMPPPPPRPSQPTAAPIATTPIVVNSNPSGADIYLNGTPTQKMTPARIEVPAQGSFTLTLKLARFLDYTKSNLTADRTGRSFTATLQRALVAYIDIDARPTYNSRIYVNGRLLKDEVLPINKYAVPAGTQVRVRAENLVTGISEERNITLNEEQRYKILFDLNSKRKPSGQR